MVVDALEPGALASGFRAEATYTGAGGAPIGARVHHARTGFQLDLLACETVPQAYVWARTPCDDDRGAPHTLEHLVLGKGNRGRAIASAQAFQLVTSSAFTQTLRTVYHFRTAAGVAGFYHAFTERLDALLRPDFTDDEVLREVYHLGVAVDPASGALQLVEKGTVYTEMDTSYRSSGYALWGRLSADAFGADHPEARVSGGIPEQIGALTPSDIRAYHRARYRLGNMGAIVVLPPGALAERLARMDEVLCRLDDGTGARSDIPRDVPPYRPTAERGLRNLTYPARPGEGLVSTHLAWLPRDPTYVADLQDDLRSAVFSAAVATTRLSNLYKALVDAETRERSTGVKSLWLHPHREDVRVGRPWFGAASDLPADTSDDTLAWIRDRICAELVRIAELTPGDPRLVDLGRRMRTALAKSRRAARMVLAEPPQFGNRSTNGGLFRLLEALAAEGGANRSLTRDEVYASVTDEVERTGAENPWRAHLERWGLTDPPALTYVVRPDAGLLGAIDEARRTRLAAATRDLAAAHGGDVQAALLAHQAQTDASAQAIEAGRTSASATLVADPPLSHDPGLAWREDAINGVPALVVPFASMPGACVRLGLDLTRVPAALRPLLAVLPALLTRVGARTPDGEELSADDVEERLRTETRSVRASLSTHPDTGRAELSLVAEGTDPRETERAVWWVRALLHGARWDADNLPRLRFLVERHADSLLDRAPSGRMAWAWRWQADALALRCGCDATQQYDVLRLSWRLRAPDPAIRDAVARAFEALGRGEPIAVPPADDAAHEVIDRARRDVTRVVRDLPPASVDADRAALCARLFADWLAPPSVALDELRALRDRVAVREGAHLIGVGGAALDAVRPELEALVGSLADTSPTDPRDVGVGAPAKARIAARGGDPDAGHLSWGDPQRRTATIGIEAPFHRVSDPSDEAVLDVLAALALCGGGGHSLFMRTWGEGLAYSNGAAWWGAEGVLRYAADRCPDVAQTVSFAAATAKDTKIDADIAAYAVASVFSSRAHQSPQERGFALASELADGRPPAMIEAHRRAVLAAAARPDLAEVLDARKDRVFGLVFPVGHAFGPGVISLIEGDERQLGLWNGLLTAAGGRPAEPLFPSDFWLVDAEPTA